MGHNKKEKCDFILMILNCEKHLQKAKQQTEEWLRLLPKNIKWFHIRGNPELKTEFEFHTNTIIVKTPDDYNSLPQKVITALKAIHETFDFQFVFKTDDDQSLIKKDFFEQIIQICNQNKPDYGGHLIKVPGHYSTYFTVHPCLPKNLFLEETMYATGRFYLLSKRSVDELLKKREYISKKIIEDHAIGFYLPDECKIRVLGFNSSEFFKDRIPS